ncbi:hypothetical protein ACIBL3_46660 [Kribbella sp. NPDC050124]|uniref:hypothetical protein n=1 Tax=Kribbella sp. NPDC050124 TaxID=3364114 RepID=UPI0037957212
MTIRPPKQPLTKDQQQVMAAFTTFITAQRRFYSHPWIIDPVYISLILPKSPYGIIETDDTGLIGPQVIHVLSVDAPTAHQATVAYCVDDRALRYLGQDGTIDIPGPSGDRRRSTTIGYEDTQFQLTTAAAIDGKPSPTPRWIASDGGSSDGAKECRGLAASPPPPAPTPTNTP